MRTIRQAYVIWLLVGAFTLGSSSGDTEPETDGSPAARCDDTWFTTRPPQTSDVVGLPTQQAMGSLDPASTSSSGLEGTISLADAHTKFIGQRRNDYLGQALSLAGDLNGDGRDDVVLGVPYADVVEVQAISDYSSIDENVGKVYVIYDPEPGDFSLAYADVQMVGASLFAYAGRSVSSTGDVNGDGLADLVVSATGAGALPYGWKPGQAYLYYSPHPRNLFERTVDADFLGSGEESALGWSVSNAGDLNGDGYDDVVASMPGGSDVEKVLVFYAPFEGGYAAEEADVTISGMEWSTDFGWQVSSEGDLNGDGMADVVVSAPQTSSSSCEAGVVYVFFSPLRPELNVLDADTAIYGTTWAAYAGISFSTGGDVNGDGFDDLLVGAYGFRSHCYPEEEEDNDGRGFAYLFYGPVEGEKQVAEADVTLNGGAPVEQFGNSVALTGDLDADHFDDLVIGATSDDEDENAGAVFIYYGPLLSSACASGDADATLLGEEKNMSAGRSLASGGDVNGDGYDDILIGATGGGPHGEYGGTVYLVLGGPRGQESGP